MESGGGTNLWLAPRGSAGQELRHSLPARGDAARHHCQHGESAVGRAHGGQCEPHHHQGWHAAPPAVECRSHPRCRRRSDRHHGVRAGHYGTATSGRSTASAAEDGGNWATDGRSCPQLQQHAIGHHRQRGPGPGKSTGSCGVIPTRCEPRLGESGGYRQAAHAVYPGGRLRSGQTRRDSEDPQRNRRYVPDHIRSADRDRRQRIRTDAGCHGRFPTSSSRFF